MKKKHLGILLCILMFLSLSVGCSAKEGDSTKATVKAENGSNKNSLINLKEKNVIADTVEYTVKYMEGTKKLEPSITNEFYTFQESKTEGHLLLNTAMEIKSLLGEKIQADNLVKLTYKIGEKEYKANLIVEVNGGTDLEEGFIASFDPLATNKVHFIAEVPESELGKDIAITMEIKDKKYAATTKLDEMKMQKQVAAIGQVITSKDFAEVKLNNMEFKTRVNPSNPGEFYTYYDVKDAANIYLALEVDVKNLKQNEVGADEIMGVRVKVDDKYNYNSFSIIEESGGRDFTYSNITSIAPLTTSKMVFLAEIPKEVQNGKIEVEININGEKYFLNSQQK